MRVRKQLSLYFICFAFVPLLLVSLSILYITREAISDQVFNKLEASAFNIQFRIRDIVKKYQDRIDLIASRTQLRISLKNYLDTADEAHLTKVSQILTDATNSIQHLEGIVVVDNQDSIVLSSFKNVQTSSLKTLLAEHASPQKINFFRDPSTGDLKVLSYAPLILDETSIAKLYILAPALEVTFLSKEPQGLGESSEILIAHQTRKGQVEFLTPLKFSDVNTFDFKDSTYLPIAETLAGHLQITYDDVLDYRNQEVFCVTRYLKELDWAIAVKIDKAEALSVMKDAYTNLMITILLITILSLLISQRVAGAFTEPILNLLSGLRKAGEEYFVKIPKPGKDNEMSEVINEFNTMIFKLAEAHETSRTLASIVKTSSDAIYSCDTKGQITSWNSAAEKLFGYQAKEIIGEKIEILAPEEKYEEIRANFKTIVDGKPVLNLKTYRNNKIGENIDVSISASPLGNDKGDILGISIITRDIREQQKQERRILESLKEKEVLLKEIHHRVKNNMQVISSLLKLQRGYLEDDNQKSVLNVCENRIRSMSLIHEKLYQSTNFSSINLKDYIEQLVSELRQSYSDKLGLVSFKIEVEDIDLNIDKAIPCGLALNEMVTNAFKHAFEAVESGELEISLAMSANRIASLVVKDNGCGLPEKLDFKNPSSLGIELIQTLAEQLRGELNIDTSENGTAIELSFPIDVNQYQPGEKSNGSIKRPNL